MAFNFDRSGKTHPDDLRNMIIFMVAAILLWLAFDHFILTPRAEVARQAQEAAAVQATAPRIANAAEEKILSRQDVLAEGERLRIDAPELLGSFSTTGLRIDDIVLRNYYTELDKKDQVVLMSPAGTEHPYYAEIGWLADDPAVQVPGRNTAWTVKSQGDLTPENPIVLTWTSNQGLTFGRRITVDRNYVVRIAQTVANAGSAPVTLYPFSMVARRGFTRADKGPGFEGPLGYIGGDMHEISYKDVEKKREIGFSAAGGWIGFGERYWLSAIIPDQASQNSFRFSAVPDAKPGRTLYQVDVRGEAMTVAPGASVESASNLYTGAKRIHVLDDYETSLNVKHLDLAVDFGMLYFLTRPLYFLLTLFSGWVGNFGVAVIMLTLIVRVAVFPLTNASYKSFAKMRKVSPKMAELKIKYGTDKPRMQQELVKLYETEKVNPMAGCFPIVLQIPIFFAVYKVISIAIEMRHAPFFGWIQDLSVRDPLSVFNLFGVLSYNVPAMMLIGPWSVAMLVLMLIQKRMNPPPQDVIQKDIANYMPWIVTFMLSSFPSGLVIYWTFSNAISVLQQYIIMRMMGVPVYLFAPDEARAYAESQSKEITEAAERAKAEVESSKAKKEEPVKESLFDDSKPS